MTKPSYQVTMCELGQENLQNALNAIADSGGEVVSIVPDHGSGFFGSTPDRAQGFLIIARRTD